MFPGRRQRVDEGRSVLPARRPRLCPHVQRGELLEERAPLLGQAVAVAAVIDDACLAQLREPRVEDARVGLRRILAQCGSEYEWGVHVAFFGGRAGFLPAEIASLVHGGPGDACWSEPERLLVRFCDRLHATCDIDDALWGELRAHFEEAALLELLLLAGFYRTVSYLTNALRLPLEPFAARFPAGCTPLATATQNLAPPLDQTYPE
jgi:alkylhydroperoxidase family enzyme